MFNKIILVGNLTRDPELRYMPSGGAVCITGIAANRKWKRQDGTQGEDTCFIDITFFGKTAEIVNQYLRRGSKVLVEGRLKLEQWTDQNGAKRSKHTVVAENLQMLDSKSQNDGGYSNQPHNQDSYEPKPSYNQPTTNSGNQTSDIDIDDDEIPF